MDKTIFDLLKILNNNSQDSKTNAFASYPAEAFNNQPSQTDNFLPLIMSLLNKNGSLGDIFTQSSSKEPTKRDGPDEEVLL